MYDPKSGPKALFHFNAMTLKTAIEYPTRTRKNPNTDEPMRKYALRMV